MTIGLGAGIDDGYAVARRIYAHRGYEIVSDVYWESWTTPDEHGVEHPGGDHLRYMVKRL